MLLGASVPPFYLQHAPMKAFTAPHHNYHSGEHLPGGVRAAGRQDGGLEKSGPQDPSLPPAALQALTMLC